MRLIILFYSILFMSTIGYSQKDSLPDPEAYFSAIIVNNLDTSLNWYVDKLGFTILNKTEMVERGFRQANLTRGRMAIELLELTTSITAKDIAVQYGGKARPQGFFKFGFQVTQFDQWVQYLKTAKVTFHGSVVIDPVSGKKMLLIRDPDGNRIQIFEK